METLIGGYELLDYAAELIKGGELVAFPTETVYGLGANAFDVEAVNKIFIAKGRPQDNPLIVHIPEYKNSLEIAEGIPDEAYMLWMKYSPGPLTLVLKKKPVVPNIVTAGYDTVAIRIPNNKTALELLVRCALPVAAPSANLSGRVSSTEAKHVYDDLKGRIPLILDGGQCLVGIESTVLDLTKNIPVVLRPGYITAEELSHTIGNVINHKGEIINAESPGMKYSHYMPSCPCVAVSSSDSAISIYDSHKQAVIVGTDKFIECCGQRDNISLGSSPEECMRSFFKVLRNAEENYAYIILESFEGRKDYYALNNRLFKSAQGIVF